MDPVDHSLFLCLAAIIELGWGFGSPAPANIRKHQPSSSILEHYIPVYLNDNFFFFFFFSDVHHHRHITSNPMAHLLRGKQAGVPTDLSAGLPADMFVLDYVSSILSLPAMLGILLTIFLGQ